MTTGSPLADGLCTACDDRLIRYEAAQTTHPWCDETSPVAGDSAAKAMLTLAASGVAEAVLDGSPADVAALALGRAWGRRRGVGQLTHGNTTAPYAWPSQWHQAVADYAAWSADGQPIELAWQEDDTP